MDATSQLNHEWDIKHVLQPSFRYKWPEIRGIGNSLGEDKRDHMTQMHAVATGTSTGIQEERLSLLIAVQYDVEVSADKAPPISTSPRGHPNKSRPACV
jgi:hypothetical protein